MSIRAIISIFRTRPFESKELAEMDISDSERFKITHFEKVLAEQMIADVTTDDLSHFREEILRLCKDYSPTPIIVKTPDNNEDPAIKHSFLIEAGYRPSEPDSILETILFRPRDVRAYEQKKEKEMKESRTKGATIPAQLDFMKKKMQSVLEGSFKSFEDGYEQSLKELGFATNDEFRTYWMGLYGQRGNFATDDQFDNFVRAEWDKRLDKARASRKISIPPSTPSQAPYLSSIINDETIILCRIIGKNSRFVSTYQQYYLKWHHISDPVFSVSNLAEDKLTANFAYGKDPGGAR